MRIKLDSIIGLILLVTWLAGIVIAKGFWSCLFAIVIAPYAWYLVVEKIMQINGLV